MLRGDKASDPGRRVRAVIYVRVSTDGQERGGTSLATQQKECEAFALDAGWHVAEVVRDVSSGSRLERPGLIRVRQGVREGEFDVVLSHSLDRLSRNQNHLGILLDEAERATVRLEFVTERFEDSAIGRFILAARAFVAEMEREKIAERSMRGKMERARAGRIPQAAGAGLFGYQYDSATGRRVVLPDQAETVRRAFRMFLEFGSFSAVANELNRLGLATRSGRTWHPLTVRRMLSNECYVGRTYFLKTSPIRVATARGVRTRRQERPHAEWIEVQDATPAIVDEPTWEAVRLLLEVRASSAVRVTTRHLLSGLVRCRLCSAAMIGQSLRSRGRNYRYYRCRHVYDRSSGGTCDGRYVRAEALERVVSLVVHDQLASADILPPQELHDLPTLLRRYLVTVHADAHGATVEGSVPAGGALTFRIPFRASLPFQELKA